MLTLREELATQEALRERDKECKSKKQKQRIKENLQKSHANNDQLKEEREKLL